MEDYNQVGEGIVRLNHHHQRGNFSNYVAAPNGNNQICSFQLKNSGDLCFQAVKNEASTSQSLPSKFHYSILRGQPSTTATATHVYNPDRLHHHQQQHAEEEDDEGKERQGASHDQMDDMKAKIIAHPHYSNLLQAYLDCQKVGAPPEEVARLSAARQEFETRQQSSFTSRLASEDPELDQFMEAYYNMLVKYREELTRPVQEALDFMRRMEAQLNLLRNDRVRIFTSDYRSEGVYPSEEEEENSGGGEAELGSGQIDPRAEDKELKDHLLKKYSGYLGSLKQELSQKRKKGKLPKEARQKLLTWWELHYKWPYPSESEKLALAEATGLDQKQINNWFINQRKRHWKPSEEMQFMVMDGIHPQNAALYMEGHYMGDGPYRFGS